MLIRSCHNKFNEQFVRVCFPVMYMCTFQFIDKLLNDDMVQPCVQLKLCIKDT